MQEYLLQSQVTPPYLLALVADIVTSSPSFKTKLSNQEETGLETTKPKEEKDRRNRPRLTQ